MRERVRNRSRYLFLGLACMLLTAALPGQEKPTVSLSAGTDTTVTTIGGLVHYTVRVQSPDDVQVHLPPPEKKLGLFEIRDYQAPEPRRQDGQLLHEFRFTLATFDTGTVVIPPIDITWFMPPDTSMHTLSTDPVAVQVLSVAPDLSGDIRGLKPQAEIPRDRRLLSMYIAVALAVLLLLGLAWWYFRYHRRGETPFVRREPPRPAHEVAMEALLALQKSGLIEQENGKEFCSHLSDILRHYLAGRYFVNAMELTTEETLRALQPHGLSTQQTRSVTDILSFCDLAKFARYQPEQEAMRDRLQLAIAFVEQTQIVLEPEEDSHRADDKPAQQPAEEETAP